MISVEEARERIIAAIRVMPAEQVALTEAVGRTLAEDVHSRVTQPPADVSAMDGYAVRAADIADVPVSLKCVGEVPAGGSFEGTLGAGEAVRIFTGAALPDGADTIVIQEDTESDGNQVTVKEGAPEGTYVRTAGLDFETGERGLADGTLLGPRHIGLAAAMNRAWLRVRRKPRVAILATGDEIVLPGDPVGPNQIVSSNSWALGAFVAANGGIPVQLGIAADNSEALRDLAASAQGADLLVTSGGASVGKHDLVRSALGEAGLAVDFWRIAMRPGKPLMYGAFGETPFLGLPGNPVSSLVCALVFLKPMLDKLTGRSDTVGTIGSTARLGVDLEENDRRQDYLRATLQPGEDGLPEATPFPEQDSSMLSLLVRAECLIVRPPHDPPRRIGDVVDIIRFEPPAAIF